MEDSVPQLISDAMLDKAFVKARSYLKDVCRSPAGISTHLDGVYQAYDNAGRPKECVRLLLASDSAIWKRLPLLGRLGRLIENDDAFAIYSDRITQMAESARKWEFGENEYIIHYDLKIRKLLFKLKFAGCELSTHGEGLFADREKIIDQIRFDQRALKFLFAHRRNKSVSWDDWSLEVKRSRAIEHLFRDQEIPQEVKHSLLDESYKKDDILNFDESKGKLVLLHHGGYASTRVALFDILFPEAVFFTNQKSLDLRIEIGEDGSKGLFEGLKVLMKSGMLVVSPDGKRGLDGEQISVLGEPFNIKDGAALFAFESRCQTIWYAMSRKGRTFVPILRKGPEVHEGEDFATFKKRMAGFYESCLNEYFTGDPETLVYTSQWTKFFHDANLRQQQCSQ
jgi:hypothetical protein